VLTDAGFAVLAAAAPGHVEEVRANLFDQLTGEQVRQFGEICRVLLTHLDPHDDADPATPTAAAATR
jgi:hypothetical protein